MDISRSSSCCIVESNGDGAACPACGAGDAGRGEFLTRAASAEFANSNPAHSSTAVVNLTGLLPQPGCPGYKPKSLCQLREKRNADSPRWFTVLALRIDHREPGIHAAKGWKRP